MHRLLLSIDPVDKVPGALCNRVCLFHIMHSMKSVLAFVALIACVAGAPSEDEVTSLPGWEGKLPAKVRCCTAGEPPLQDSSGSARSVAVFLLGLGCLGQIWSGYVTVGSAKDRHIHYWFANSQGNPDKDPLVLWTNGALPQA